MKFTEAPLAGAYVIDLSPISDDRGFFARSFCAREFEEHGLRPAVAQANVSFNHAAGTLRGMHYQLPPNAETKLVRCVGGAIYDVIVDLRPDSPTRLQYFGVELTAQNRRALYVPELFAHGYVTLADNSEVEYQVSEFYAPGQERGLRHDDPALNIAWPIEVRIASDKDRSWALLEAVAVPRA